MSIIIRKSINIQINTKFSNLGTSIRISISMSNPKASHRIKMCAHVTLITIPGRMHTSFCLGPVFGFCL